MTDRGPHSRQWWSTLSSLLMFCVGALLLLPGIGTGLCAMFVHGAVFGIFPVWFVRMSVVLAVVGLLMVGWGFWRMIR